MTEPATGELAVDEALGRLAEAEGAPLEQQAEVFERVHHDLQDALDSPS